MFPLLRSLQSDFQHPQQTGQRRPADLPNEHLSLVSGSAVLLPNKEARPTPSECALIVVQLNFCPPPNVVRVVREPDRDNRAAKKAGARDTDRRKDRDFLRGLLIVTATSILGVVVLMLIARLA